MGAEVLHVESVGRLDGMRMAGGMFADRPQWWEYSMFFLQANLNKRGITLALDNPAGRDLAMRLIEWADVVVENFTPRVIEGFDLDWDVVHATNPRAVMVRMPAFGLDGPWRDRPGFAQTMEQLTGLAWITGLPADQPRIQRGPCDPNGGVHAAIAALVALEQRDRTGEGCVVESPMIESALAVAAEPILEWTAYGNVVERDGNRSPWAAPQGVYQGAGEQRWLALAVDTDAQWQALAAVIARPDLGSDQRLASLAGRRAAGDELDKVLAGWAAERDPLAAAATLLAAGVPAASVVDVRTTDGHPQMMARGYYEQIEHPVAGPMSVPTLPFTTGGERWVRRPAPTLGQDNAEVLGRWLKLTHAQLAELEAAHVIGTWPLGL
jgi:crotonobetainyl-CoA:carnitine CoA-transferase CaiB-like acyl-CoA transferase